MLICFMVLGCQLILTILILSEGYNNKIDNHRKSLNFDRKKIKYNKYPWESEPYNWQDLWGELYYGKI